MRTAVPIDAGRTGTSVLAGRAARPRGVASAAIVALLVGVCPGSASAQRVNVSHYATDEGLPTNRVLAVTQDASGYLWIGTEAGAVRYDGAAFRTLTAADGLVGQAITELLADDAGGLLAGSAEAGLFALRGPSARSLYRGRLPAAAVTALHADADGTTWIATSGGLVAARGDELRFFFRADGLPADACRAILRDAEGRLWVGTGGGLAALVGSTFRAVEEGLPEGVGVNALVQSHEGTLWAGTDVGLFRRGDERFEAVSLPGADRPINAATASADGTLWFGTGAGALHVRDGTVRRIGRREGLSDEAVNDVFSDREGNTWFATDSGLAKLVPGSFVTYTAADGLGADRIVAVVEGDDGTWVATTGGVSIIDPSGEVRSLEGAPANVTALAPLPDGGVLLAGVGFLVEWRNGVVRRYGQEAGLPGLTVSALVGSPDEQVWIGTSRGLWRLRDGSIRRWSGDDRLEAAAIRDLVLDRRGRLWLATTDGRLFTLEQGAATARAGPEGLGTSIQDLAVATDGSVWAATGGLGALRLLADGSTEALDRESGGLSDDFVRQVVPARDGGVWLYTSLGLDRWLPGVGLRHYGLADGLPVLGGTPGAGLADSDGRLWFGTSAGLALHSPVASSARDVAPLVDVQAVLVDGVPIDAGDLDELPDSASQIGFAFAALTFRDERGVRFRHRLLGHVDDWSRPTSDRQVVYVGVLPGEYRFEVEAVNAQGLWSEAPATVSLRVRPSLIETTWFRGLAGGLLALALLSVVVRRFRSGAVRRRHLGALLDKRTRELVEKNMHLERMATTDELTGLPNRRFFLENLERELRKLTRVPTDENLSLLVIDLDHFKSVNDRFGHAAGDEVLRQVGRRFARSVRATDLAARYGGEEFAIMLPNTDREGAEFLAEKLRSEVESTELRFGGAKVPLTISVGVATTSPPARYAPGLEDELLRRADEAMYRAKAAGRNRVEVAGPH